MATAGTTNAGIVDDLAGVADVCRERDVWLHVDGAYGGPASLAPGARTASTAWSAPTPSSSTRTSGCSALRLRARCVYRGRSSLAPRTRQTATYLDDVDHAEWNPADLAIHLSRRPRGLSLWYSLATHGTDRYREAVEDRLATARAVARDIRSRPSLRMLSEPELSVILFDRPGWSAEQLADWSHEQAVAGKVLCIRPAGATSRCSG